MKINDIRRKILNHDYHFTSHAIDKMEERNFTRREIEEAIMDGKIIEEYIEDKYSPCCLIFGRTKKMKPLHIVCSLPSRVWIITAYEPNPDEWINFEKRR